MFVDPDGTEVLRVRYGEKGAMRQKHWKAKLVLSENVEAIEAIRYIFHNYAERDIGIKTLAGELNDRGSRTPQGHLWGFSSVRKIVTNRRYAGDLVFCQTAQGKYRQVSQSEGVKAVRGKCRRSQKKKPQEEWIIHPNAHEAIVDRNLFDRVQKKLAYRKHAGRGTPTGSHAQKYLFRTLIYCGHCGKRMAGNYSYGHVRYTCRTYINFGTQKGCQLYHFRQDDLLKYFRKVVEATIFFEGDFGELVKQIIKRFDAETKNAPALVNSLEKEIARLEAAISQGARRFIQVEDETVIEAIGFEMAEIRKQRDRLAKRLKDVNKTVIPNRKRAEAERVVKLIFSLRDELNNASADRLRELWKRLIHRVTLWWKPEFNPQTRGEHVIERGELVFATEYDISSTGSVYDPKARRSKSLRNINIRVLRERKSFLVFDRRRTRLDQACEHLYKGLKIPKLSL